VREEGLTGAPDPDVMRAALGDLDELEGSTIIVLPDRVRIRRPD